MKLRHLEKTFVFAVLEVLELGFGQEISTYFLLLWICR